MYFSTEMVVYLTVYVATIIYFVVLGNYMFCQKEDLHSRPGELAAKRRMTRVMGVTMYVMALEWFVYLPPVFAGVKPYDTVFNVLYLLMLMMNTPAIYCVMFAVVQRKVNMARWICGLAFPFFLLAAWQMFPPKQFELLPVYIGSALSVVSSLFLLVKFAKEYRNYVRRIQSEYSDTTGRDIAWSWISFSGWAVQGILFAVYEVLWSPLVEILYQLFTIFNFAYLCFCISRQRTIDDDITCDNENDGSKNEAALYAGIENKLRTLFEDKLLFLTPDITLETLSQCIGTNRTYLGMYFRERGITFYQYINTLRIEYANKLMVEYPHLSLRVIAEQSGFRSQPTFRKAFQEVMGCLPSEVKTNPKPSLRSK